MYVTEALPCQACLSQRQAVVLVEQQVHDSQGEAKADAEVQLHVVHGANRTISRLQCHAMQMLINLTLNNAVFTC